VSNRKPKTGKADFARQVCDAIKDGSPDMYNGAARRVVPIEEAERQGWPHYYDGKTACPQGHVAARYVSNPAVCVDCRRIGDGKTAIYSKTEFLDALTGHPVYVDPVASDRFEWTDEKKRQLLTAWINTTDILAAAKTIGAQPSHVIDLLASDVEFKAAYEDAQRKVEQVQLWSVESRAGGGSDRLQLAMAQSKFTQFGAKTGLADRPTVNTEQARAELTQLLSVAKRALAQRARLESVARTSRSVGRTDIPAADSAGTDVEKPALLGQPHDNSDLVSDAGSESGVSEADAALPTRRKV
jgi:hypothetical protein